MWSNMNGREEKLEREFDNPQDFQSFTKQIPAFQMLNRVPFFGLDARDNFHNYFENLLDKRLGFDDQSPNDAQVLVDLNKYENALEEIEYQKSHKEEHQKHLKANLQKLKDYKKRFKEENKEDMVLQIDEDIKKIEEELKKTE